MPRPYQGADGVGQGEPHVAGELFERLSVVLVEQDDELASGQGAVSAAGLFGCGHRIPVATIFAIYPSSFYWAVILPHFRAYVCSSPRKK